MRVSAPTRRLRILGGVGEVAIGPLSVFWRAGIFAPKTKLSSPSLFETKDERLGMQWEREN